RAHRLFFIEDAAQTLGATVDGRPAGSFGDWSLFSFGRGKPLGAIGGGVLAARGEALAAMLERARLDPPAGNRLRAALTALAGGAATSPIIFAWLRLLPFVTIGRSVFDPGFTMAGLDPPRARIILDGLTRLSGAVERRQHLASLIEARLAGIRGIIVPRVRAGIVGAVLRFPVIFEDSADRDAALLALVGRGLGASPMYPKPVFRIDKARPHVRMDLGPFPGAEKIARGLVTLPTHDAVTERDVDDFASVIRAVTAAGSARVWE
ncbi:MAG: DegT/DnrJ/EryC1/StrS family aminotransferase, partial [Deltaproteobacteria bacterium]|nr:DegT/DnrJ/EryC1/StrS family aminotransferase [Deltaproteobacteria bacterium]